MSEIEYEKINELPKKSRYIITEKGFYFQNFNQEKPASIHVDEQTLQQLNREFVGKKLYEFDTLPKKLLSYTDSYILVKNELSYVNSEEQLEPENLKSIQQLTDGLKECPKENNNPNGPYLLNSDEIQRLITENGGTVRTQTLSQSVTIEEQNKITNLMKHTPPKKEEVQTNSGLLYIDRHKNICEEISLSKKYLIDFKENLQPDTESTSLSENALKQITQITGYVPYPFTLKAFNNYRQEKQIVKQLLTLTQECLQDIKPGPAKKIIEGLEKILKNNDLTSIQKIENFYQRLKESSGEDQTNLSVLQSDNSRSSARLLAGILAIAAIIVTGVIPGLIVTGIVYANKKTLPHHLFNSIGQTLGKALETRQEDDLKLTKK